MKCKNNDVKAHGGQTSSDKYFCSTFPVQAGGRGYLRRGRIFE